MPRTDYERPDACTNLLQKFDVFRTRGCVYELPSIIQKQFAHALEPLTSCRRRSAEGETVGRSRTGSDAAQDAAEGAQRVGAVCWLGCALPLNIGNAESHAEAQDEPQRRASDAVRMRSGRRSEKNSARLKKSVDMRGLM